MIRLDSTRLLSLVNSQNGCETQATGIARTTTAAPGLMEEHVISSATTTTICAAPAAGTTNELDHVTIKNTYAGANTVEVKIVGAVTTHSAYAVLQQNESLEFTHAQGWRTLDASGQEKITVGGTGGNFAVGGNLTVAGTATVTGASSVAALTASGLITASAGLTVASGQTLTPGGLIDASGASAGQIKFPATQNASSNANTLDDYQDAKAWTPIDSSGASLSFTVNAAGCIAYKIGSMVYCFVDLTFPATASGATVKIGGLPFACKSTTNDISVNLIAQNASASTMTGVVHVGDTTFGISLFNGTSQVNSTFTGAVVRGCLIYAATA